MVNISNPFRKAKATEDHFRGDIKFKAGQSDTTLIAKCRANGVEADVVVTALTSVVPPDVHRRVFGGRGRQFAHVGVLKRLERDIVQKKLIPGWEQHEFCRGPAKLVECCEENWRALVDYAGVDEVFDFKLINESTVSQVELIRDEIDELHGAFVEQGEDIKKKVVEAATDIRDGVGQVLVGTAEMLVEDQKKNRDKIIARGDQNTEELKAHQDRNTDRVVDALDGVTAALLRLEAAQRDQRALPRADQLALEDQAYGEPVQAELVEPSSGGGDTVGALMTWTPRTNSAGIRVGRAPSLLERHRSPESPESLESPASQEEAEAVPVAALDETFAVAPPLEAVEAASDDKAVAEAPSPVLVERGTPTGPKTAAALDDDGTVAAAAPVATPARAVGFEEELLRTSQSAWKYSRKKLALAENFQDQQKYPSPPVRDCPKEGKKKDPNFCPGKLELSDVNPTP